MENPELTKINNIQNESKLSKSTKNAEKYKKISTDEENQDETQIDSITIEKKDYNNRKSINKKICSINRNNF